jgi:hypothetical protein
MSKQDFARAIGAAMQAAGQGLLTLEQAKVQQSTRAFEQDVRARTLRLHELSEQRAADTQTWVEERAKITDAAQINQFDKQHLEMVMHNRVTERLTEQTGGALAKYHLQAAKNLTFEQRMKFEKAINSMKYNTTVAVDARKASIAITNMTLETSQQIIVKLAELQARTPGLDMAGALEQFLLIAKETGKDGLDPASLALITNTELITAAEMRAGITKGVPEGSGKGQEPTEHGRDVDVSGSVSEPMPTKEEQIEALVTSLVNVSDTATVDSALLAYQKSHPNFSDADVRRVKMRLGAGAYTGRVQGEAGRFTVSGEPMVDPLISAARTVGGAITDVGKAIITPKPPANPRSRRLLQGGGS